MTNLNIAFMKRGDGGRGRNISADLSSSVFAVLIVLTISYFAVFPCVLFSLRVCIFMFLCGCSRWMIVCACACAPARVCVWGWLAAYCELREEIMWLLGRRKQLGK